MVDLNPVWDGRGWTCFVDAPAWHSLYLRGRPRLGSTFLPPDDRDDVPPSPSQLAELIRFLERQEALRASVDKKIRSYYRRMRPRYVDFFDDPEEQMPEQLTDEDFVRLHVLQGLFVHREDADSLVHIGLSFRALWEIEHGLGVLVCGDSIVSVGGADTAFLAP